jgi:uncharacterized protein YndB with AHSA1/START domain
VVEEPLDPILIQVTVPLPVPMIYSALTVDEQLQGWLCEKARVKAEVGGPYVLAWKAPVAFESSGKVLRLTRDRDIEFSWFGPPPFAHLMNEPVGKTRVYVRLQESPEGVDVTLEHFGWESGEAWEEARSWHFHLWDERLNQLKDYLLKAAYG